MLALEGVHGVVAGWRWGRGEERGVDGSLISSRVTLSAAGDGWEGSIGRHQDKGSRAVGVIAEPYGAGDHARRQHPPRPMGDRLTEGAGSTQRREQSASVVAPGGLRSGGGVGELDARQRLLDVQIPLAVVLVRFQSKTPYVVSLFVEFRKLPGRRLMARGGRWTKWSRRSAPAGGARVRRRAVGQGVLERLAGYSGCTPA